MDEAEAESEDEIDDVSNGCSTASADRSSSPEIAEQSPLASPPAMAYPRSSCSASLADGERVERPPACTPVSAAPTHALPPPSPSTQNTRARAHARTHTQLLCTQRAHELRVAEANAAHACTHAQLVGPRWLLLLRWTMCVVGGWMRALPITAWARVECMCKRVPFKQHSQLQVAHTPCPHRTCASAGDGHFRALELSGLGPRRDVSASGYQRRRPLFASR